MLLCYFYIIFIFILLHCPLSGPDLIYISLLIIPCIIYYVTNKETLNLYMQINYLPVGGAVVAGESEVSSVMLDTKQSSAHKRFFIKHYMQDEMKMTANIF